MGQPILFANTEPATYMVLRGDGEYTGCM